MTSSSDSVICFSLRAPLALSQALGSVVMEQPQLTHSGGASSVYMFETKMLQPRGQCQVITGLPISSSRLIELPCAHRFIFFGYHRNTFGHPASRIRDHLFDAVLVLLAQLRRCAIYRHGDRYIRIPFPQWVACAPLYSASRAVLHFGAEKARIKHRYLTTINTPLFLSGCPH